MTPRPPVLAKNLASPIASAGVARDRRRTEFEATRGRGGRGRWLACLLALELVAGLRAQRERINVLVRDEHGRPAAGVRAFWCSRHDAGLGALEDALPPSGGSGTTDERGLFSLETSVPVALWLRGEAAGALLPRVAPGAPQRVQLAPVTPLDLGSGAVGAWVASGGVCFGRLDGQRLALPPGSYDLLIEHPDGWFVTTCTPGPAGATTLERPSEPAAKLVLCEDQTAHVRPFGWVELPRDQRGSVALPAADHPLRVSIRTGTGRDVAVDEVWAPPAREITAPVVAAVWRNARIVDAAGTPVVEAMVTTAQFAGDAWQLRAASRSDRDGRAALRVLEDAVVLVSAPNRALAIARLDEVGEILTLTEGVSVRLRVTDPRGSPVPEARVSVRLDSRFPARVCVTDAHGEVEIPSLPAQPVHVRVDDQGFLPAMTVIDPQSGRGHEIVLDDGLAIRGTITAGGRPWPGVSVVVRDPSGLLGVDARRTVTDALGSFGVTGLPAGDYTVSARCDVDGYTWSAQRVHVVAGSRNVRLAVACEDPPLPKPRPRR
ncbi:MAG: carboxypeptidase-like regulatory domain-containing protein [Planctomycetota bacterium]